MSEVLIEAPYGDAEADELLDLDAPVWQESDSAQLPLTPTPLERQPSAYVQASWSGKPRGAVASAEVRALHTTRYLAVWLSWAQAAPVRGIDDHNAFADACAVLFPANGKHAELETMGSEAEPVAGWYWRAGTATPYEITAHGLGTVTRADTSGVRAAARWAYGRWQVVMVRRIDQGAPSLVGAFEVPLAVAVWCGDRDERAGLKSYSPAFSRLQLVGG